MSTFPAERTEPVWAQVKDQGRTLIVHPSQSSWGSYPGQTVGPVEVTIEEDKIVIRRAGTSDDDDE